MSEEDEKLEKLQELISKHEKEGKIAFYTFEGLMLAPLDGITEQPADGLLYDLNRDKVTIWSTAKENKVRWVNDYATSLVLEKLHNDRATLRALLGDAMKALEPFAEEGRSIPSNYDGDPKNVYYTVHDLRTAADVYARIKATQTGGE